MALAHPMLLPASFRQAAMLCVQWHLAGRHADRASDAVDVHTLAARHAVRVVGALQYGGCDQAAWMPPWRRVQSNARQGGRLSRGCTSGRSCLAVGAVGWVWVALGARAGRATVTVATWAAEGGAESCDECDVRWGDWMFLLWWSTCICEADDVEVQRHRSHRLCPRRNRQPSMGQRAQGATAAVAAPHAEGPAGALAAAGAVAWQRGARARSGGGHGHRRALSRATESQRRAQAQAQAETRGIRGTGIEALATEG